MQRRLPDNANKRDGLEQIIEARNGGPPASESHFVFGEIPREKHELTTASMQDDFELLRRDNLQF